MPIYKGGKCPFVTTNILFTWLYDGLETQRLSFTIVGSPCPSNPVLPYLEPQEIKSHSVVVVIESMGNLGFAWFQFQTQILQPPGTAAQPERTARY